MAEVEEVSEMVGDGMSDMSGGGRRLAVVDGGGRESPSGLWSFLKVIPSKGEVSIVKVSTIGTRVSSTATYMSIPISNFSSSS
ncbi:hypothetical protein R6Q59_028397 [Mikania micrantha]